MEDKGLNDNDIYNCGMYIFCECIYSFPFFHVYILFKNNRYFINHIFRATLKKKISGII